MMKNILLSLLMFLNVNSIEIVLNTYPLKYENPVKYEINDKEIIDFCNDCSINTYKNLKLDLSSDWEKKVDWEMWNIDLPINEMPIFCRKYSNKENDYWPIKINETEEILELYEAYRSISKILKNINFLKVKETIRLTHREMFYYFQGHKNSACPRYKKLCDQTIKDFLIKNSKNFSNTSEDFKEVFMIIIATEIEKFRKNQFPDNILFSTNKEHILDACEQIAEVVFSTQEFISFNTKEEIVYEDLINIIYKFTTYTETDIIQALYDLSKKKEEEEKEREEAKAKEENKIEKSNSSCSDY